MVLTTSHLSSRKISSKSFLFSVSEHPPQQMLTKLHVENQVLLMKQDLTLLGKVHSPCCSGLWDIPWNKNESTWQAGYKRLGSTFFQHRARTF